MLVYEKESGGARHLFGNYSGNVPTADDPQLTYKDYDGDVISPVANDTYVDGGSADGVQRIKRLSDGKIVNVFIGDHAIIGEVVTPKVVKKIAVTTKPTKLEYAKNDTLDLTGMVVTGTYSDGDTFTIASDAYTTSPVDGATLDTAGSVTVTVTHTASSKTASFKVTVTE